MIFVLDYLVTWIIEYVVYVNMWIGLRYVNYMIIWSVMNSFDVCMLYIAYYYIFLWWCEFSPFCWNDVLCDIAQVLKIVVLCTRITKKPSLVFSIRLGSESMLWSCNTWGFYVLNSCVVVEIYYEISLLIMYFWGTICCWVALVPDILDWYLVRILMNIVETWL